MKLWIKIILILVGTFVFYILTGSGAVSLLLLVLLIYFELNNKLAKKNLEVAQELLNIQLK